MSVVTPALPPQPTPPAPRRRWVWIVAITAAVGVVVAPAAYVLGYLGAKLQSPPVTFPSPPIATRVDQVALNDACARETIVIGHYLFQGVSPAELTNAVGAQNQVYLLGTRLLPTVRLEVARSGPDGSWPAIWRKARELCSESGNPLLTRSEIRSLSRRLHPDDAQWLSEITVFG